MLLQSEGIRLSIYAASYPRRTEVALVLVSFFYFFMYFFDGEFYVCDMHGKENSSVPTIVTIISFTMLLI